MHEHVTILDAVKKFNEIVRALMFMELNTASIPQIK